MAAKLMRLTHKITIQLHLVAENCTTCSSRSRRPVRKLLDTLSYSFKKAKEYFESVVKLTVKVPLSYRQENYIFVFAILQELPYKFLYLKVCHCKNKFGIVCWWYCWAYTLG
jgi:hypothetical protein